MTIHTQLLDLLAKKKEIFLQIEEVTSNMAILPIEDLVTHTDKRGTLLNEISRIDEEIKLLCNDTQDFLDALNNNSERHTLSEELAELFDASLSVKAVVNRILKNEDTARLHMEAEKQRVLEKVESLNISGTAVANRYHRSIQGGTNHLFPVGNDKLI